MAFDNLCKHLAEQHPADFAAWLLGEKTGRVEVLKTELSIEPIRADSVTFLRGAGQILHLEFQVKPVKEPALPLRMLDYWVRLHRKYNLPVTQILLMLKETNIEIPNEFRAANLRFQFRVLKMWEQDAQFLLQNESLLPLAVLAKTTDKKALLETVAERIKHIKNEEKRRDILAETNILAGLRYSENLVKMLLREEIMKESVTYQAIIREGMNQVKHHEVDLILRQLKRRIGEVDDKTRQRIARMSFAKLNDLGEALLDFNTPEDLQNWLNRQKAKKINS